MNKSDALKLFGGSTTKAAAAIGCTPQAVSQWPDPLTPRISDRVAAAVVRLKAHKGKSKSDTAQSKVQFKP
jgi:hypothetical protein